MNRFHCWCLICVGTWFVCSGTCLAADQPTPRPGRLIPLLGEGQGNLVPNASFECGTDGWGSAELTFLPGWYSSLNGLFGRLDPTTAADGRCSLKIELTPENQPIAYNDYLHTQSRRIEAPLAANLGWIAVKPGCNYTFSVAMKAAEEGTPARLVVRQFHAAPIEKPVVLTTDWRRYKLDFKPEAEACYVLAGPELRPTEDHPQPPERATVWLDAVRLAPSEMKTPFLTRQPVEFGLVSDKPGNIFAWDEPLRFHLTVASSDPEQRKAELVLRLTDFYDKEIWRERLSADVPVGASWEKEVSLPPSPERRGFLRLEATMTSGKIVESHLMRLAAIPIDQQADSRFGLNHAFGWPDQLMLSRQAGLLWARDWSLKWQDVEPKKGQFTFVETDAEINRLLRQNLNVLGVLAFPSTMWSSSAPAEIQPPDPWHYSTTLSPDPERRRDEVLCETGSPHVRLGYAPRDLDEYKNYVAKTVTHYKDRIHDWQAFNEPLDCQYAFNAAEGGYSMADYVRHLEIFAKTARQCDPECRLFGGFILGDPKGTAKRLEEFIALGGLKQLDVLTYHAYPGRQPPEFAEEVLQEVRAVMDRQDIRKPIWFTELAYFADDEPWEKPWTHWAPLLSSERVQAEYQVRMSTILFANGVEKLFYHAGIGAGINHTPMWTMFLRYGNEPFKCYASQAVLSQWLTPTCKFIKRLLSDTTLRVYLFHDANRTIAVVWAPADVKSMVVQLADAKLQVWDIMGRPQSTRTFTPTESPVFVIGEGVTDAEFEKALIVLP